MALVNRQKTQNYLLEWIEKLFPGTGNQARMAAQFNRMTDRQFDDYMARLEARTETLRVTLPNFKGMSIDKDLMRTASVALGRPIWQKLHLSDNATGMIYETPKPYPVLLLPLRAQEQILDKKKNIPKDNKHIDDLSAQVTGKSKASKLSNPELQMVFAQKMDKTIIEMLKFRGGDLDAMRAMNKMIAETGNFRQSFYPMDRSRPKSVETASTLMFGMHLNNNF